MIAKKAKLAKHRTLLVIINGQFEMVKCITIDCLRTCDLVVQHILCLVSCSLSN